MNDSNFIEANYIINKIITLCHDLGDNPKNMSFYKYIDVIDLALKSEEDLTDKKKLEQEMSVKETQLKFLLKSLLYDVEGIIALTISDREGFILTSESKLENQNDELLVAMAGSIDMYIDRVKREFGSEGNFFNITNLSDQKLSYCSMGPHAILTALSAPSTSDTELKVYCEHIANKIELILEGQENVSLDIPDLIKVLSKMKSGIIPKGEFSTKLILTGDFRVGKTSLVRRFVQNLFQDNYISTIGVSISKKKINLAEDTRVDFVIWDIGGQITQMTPYRKRFFEGASTAFIVFDRTRHQTFNNVDVWYNEITKHIADKISIIIVGNKSDLADKIEVSEEEIKEKAKNYGFHYILTSAKTGENVNEAFNYIAYKLLESI
jgi:small GTP-binding protein